MRISPPGAIGKKRAGYVKQLIDAVCPRAHRATSLSEATLFRLIDTDKPLLLIDEAKQIEGNSERGELLRAILHEGYRLGGKVPRCQGDDHEIRRTA